MFAAAKKCDELIYFFILNNPALVLRCHVFLSEMHANTSTFTIMPFPIYIEIRRIFNFNFFLWEPIEGKIFLKHAWWILIGLFHAKLNQNRVISVISHSSGSELRPIHCYTNAEWSPKHNTYQHIFTHIMINGEQSHFLLGRPY